MCQRQFGSPFARETRLDDHGIYPLPVDLQEGGVQLIRRFSRISLDLLGQMLAERTGLEPATPGVTGRYSNQLNYRSYLYVSWWVLTGSNRRHSPCKSDALPAELSTLKKGR